MHRLLCAITTILVARGSAHAASACGHGEGWALDSQVVPVRAHLGYYLDARSFEATQAPTLSATIDGKPVTATVKFVPAPPYVLAAIEIDSDKTGTLALKWQAAKGSYRMPQVATVTYEIRAKLQLPAEAHGTSSRFHQAYRHSTVHESDDGLAIAVDVPAITFSARWRVDDKAAWQTVALTAITVDGKQVARLGELGCVGNFGVAILEHGVDLELGATLVDGRSVKVVGLPAHVVLPPLPRTTPRSSP